MKKTIFILLVGIISLTACRKEPSTRRYKFLGTWHIDKFYVNDIDSTASFHSQFGDSLYFKYYLKNTKEDDYLLRDNDIYLFKRIHNLVCYYKYSYLRKLSYGLEIHQKDECCSASLSTNTIIGVRNVGKYVLWRIKKLTNKKLNMEASDTLNNKNSIEMTKVLNNGHVLKY